MEHNKHIKKKILGSLNVLEVKLGRGSPVSKTHLVTVEQFENNGPHTRTVCVNRFVLNLCIRVI